MDHMIRAAIEGWCFLKEDEMDGTDKFHDHGFFVDGCRLSFAQLQAVTPISSACQTILGSALLSVANAMSACAHDWSNDPHHAWIYGVLVGWGDALPEIASKFKWSDSLVMRVRQLRDEVQQEQGAAAE